MATITLNLSDDLNAALQAHCALQGRPTDAVLCDLLRRYLDAEKLKQVLQEPELAQLYQELEAEDLSLAEAGLSAYDEQLREADQP